MTTINFPSSPVLNQTYTFGGKTWTYNGTGWVISSSTSASATSADALSPFLLMGA